MSDDKDLNMFDEDQAIKFIRGYLPPEKSELYSDDEILNIIDMIWDFYEDNGLLELPDINASDDEDSPELAQIVDYVKKTLSKDKLAVVDKEDVPLIVEAELAYERSIEI